MSLHFGICWIEDQASDAMVEQVAGAVRASGFEPLIERIEQEDDIREFAARQNHHQDFDLILLDLNLGRGLTGDDLAHDIRASFRSTTILFYSAMDEAILRDAMAKKKVEGVYCVHRDRLANRVGELVSHLSPALNRLSSMRGLAARIVAECDHDFRAILGHLGTNGSADEIVASLKAKISTAAQQQVGTVNSHTTLDGLLGSHAVHSAALFNEVRERANALGGDELLVIARKLKQGYLSQVINRRNTLAHALEARGENGWHIVRASGDPVTVDDFPRYRKEFQNQLSLVRRMRALMMGE